jgi:hypothetical protein
MPVRIEAPAVERSHSSRLAAVGGHAIDRRPRVGAEENHAVAAPGSAFAVIDAADRDGCASGRSKLAQARLALEK